jgi:hypothetical protein
MMFAKINRDCTPARTKAALDGYIKCEQSVRDFDKLRTPRMYEEFAKMSTMLYGNVFTKIDHKVYYDGVIPKHGPGSTADHISGNQKYDQVEWTERLEEVFPAAEYLLPNWRFLPDLDRLTWLEPGAERPVRVVTVPKTLKTPRIIAIEPVCMQYMQQGLMDLFVKGIERDDILSSFIGFTDQTPNQRMAMMGSMTGSLATLDLSEASDRVSNQLVRRLFNNHGTLARMVDATRSRKADLGENGGVIRLAKFASMGSALCFPVEAMVFLTLIFMGIQDGLSKPLTRQDIESFKGKVRVYGDDMIVPVEYVLPVMRRLETFGFKVNADKSFWTGKFRESCGKDYYAGEDVTVTRVRRDFPSSLRDAQEVISLVSLRNQLYQRGLWQTVKWLDKEIETLIPFPAVNHEWTGNGYSKTSPALGKHSFLGIESQRMCASLHRPLVKAAVTRTVTPPSKLEGVGALMKFFLKSWSFETIDETIRDTLPDWLKNAPRPFVDKKHYERYGRPDTVGIKIRWAPAS